MLHNVISSLLSMILTVDILPLLSFNKTLVDSTTPLLISIARPFFLFKSLLYHISPSQHFFKSSVVSFYPVSCIHTI